jgi:uncharacterized membrane protein
MNFLPNKEKFRVMIKFLPFAAISLLFLLAPKILESTIGYVLAKEIKFISDAISIIIVLYGMHGFIKSMNAIEDTEIRLERNKRSGR